MLERVGGGENATTDRGRREDGHLFSAFSTRPVPMVCELPSTLPTGRPVGSMISKHDRVRGEQHEHNNEIRGNLPLTRTTQPQLRSLCRDLGTLVWRNHYQFQSRIWGSGHLDWFQWTPCHHFQQLPSFCCKGAGVTDLVFRIQTTITHLSLTGFPSSGRGTSDSDFITSSASQCILKI